MESESKGCDGTVVGYGPEPSAMIFDYGTTDRQPHAQAAGFGRMESIKDSFGRQWIKADSGVSHRNPDLITLAALGG